MDRRPQHGNARCFNVYVYKIIDPFTDENFKTNCEIDSTNGIYAIIEIQDFRKFGFKGVVLELPSLLNKQAVFFLVLADHGNITIMTLSRFPFDYRFHSFLHDGAIAIAATKKLGAVKG